MESMLLTRYLNRSEEEPEEEEQSCRDKATYLATLKEPEAARNMNIVIKSVCACQVALGC
jgi:hypothetical protein